MPQNDVLGHPQTRAFLSQCGANSLYEVRKCLKSFLGLCSFHSTALRLLCPLNAAACGNLMPKDGPRSALRPCQASASAPMLWNRSLLQLVVMQAAYNGVPYNFAAARPHATPR